MDYHVVKDTYPYDEFWFLCHQLYVICYQMLAKLASGMNKPAQQTIVPFSSVKGLLDPLPIKKMWVLDCSTRNKRFVSKWYAHYVTTTCIAKLHCLKHEQNKTGFNYMFLSFIFPNKQCIVVKKSLFSGSSLEESWGVHYKVTWVLTLLVTFCSFQRQDYKNSMESIPGDYLSLNYFLWMTTCHDLISDLYIIHESQYLVMEYC